MKKFRLDLGDLRVDTFETQADALPGRGTVHGRQITLGPPACTNEDCTKTGCSSWPNPCFCTEIGETCPACHEA